ncbi:hypothetical protein I7I53_10881 [Histoplasma capsulatum var. duboisii H88]|uniref:Uncharacterized protein n=1 Tax=Ajellomyces capsulatus (strain H88) TaxID=544711 RepID=A0A8A1LCS2_AJEC8|nr:hypothetical protein I7I53_10881 [Histoplasma capsulatum var. duboisii H88]
MSSAFPWCTAEHTLSRVHIYMYTRAEHDRYMEHLVRCLPARRTSLASMTMTRGETRLGGA